jgi:hypothetical protein
MQRQPAILAGALVAHGDSILATSRGYGATIMLLAALATLGLIIQRQIKAPQCLSSPRGKARLAGAGARCPR